MKVILREDVKNKGVSGDIIDVKPGFARNFLIPKGFAYEATPAATKVYEREQYLKAKESAKLQADAEKLKLEIEKISLTIAVKSSDDERLFGSVTSNVIADLLKEKGYDINHRKVKILDPIKELGVFEVGIDLGSSVVATVKIWVVKE
jgi:large subunit ribosomal protein L9